MPNSAMSRRFGRHCIDCDLPYAVGISSHADRASPHGRASCAARHATLRGSSADPLAHGRDPSCRSRVRALIAQVPRSAWRRVTWRNGTQPTRQARFTAVRVTPAHEWRRGRSRPRVWLLCEEEAGATSAASTTSSTCRRRAASLRRLVRLTHQRWAIEQQYQELKSELGLDHFEGRTWPGWQHHAVLDGRRPRVHSTRADAPGRGRA